MNPRRRPNNSSVPLPAWQSPLHWQQPGVALYMSVHAFSHCAELVPSKAKRQPWLKIGRVAAPWWCWLASNRQRSYARALADPSPKNLLVNWATEFNSDPSTRRVRSC